MFLVRLPLVLLPIPQPYAVAHAGSLDCSLASLVAQQPPCFPAGTWEYTGLPHKMAGCWVDIVQLCDTNPNTHSRTGEEIRQTSPFLLLLSFYC